MPDSQRFGLTHRIAGMSPQLSRIFPTIEAITSDCKGWAVRPWTPAMERFCGPSNLTCQCGTFWPCSRTRMVMNSAGLGGRIPLGEYDNPRGDHYHSLSTVCIYKYIYMFTIGSGLHANWWDEDGWNLPPCRMQISDIGGVFVLCNVICECLTMFDLYKKAPAVLSMIVGEETDLRGFMFDQKFCGWWFQVSHGDGLKWLKPFKTYHAIFSLAMNPLVIDMWLWVAM